MALYLTYDLLAKKHLIESHPNRPNISLTIVRLMIQNLRSHIQRRSKNSLSSLILRSQQFGKSEISQLNNSIMLQNVCQFKISVHNLTLDQRLECMQYLYKVLKCLLLGKLLLSLDGSQKIALITVLKNEVNIIDCFFDVNQSNYVVILATFQHLNLVFQQLGELP